MYFLTKTPAIHSLSKILAKHTKYITVTPTTLTAISSIHAGIKIHVLCSPMTNTTFTIRTDEFCDLDGPFEIRNNCVEYKKIISTGARYCVEKRVPMIDNILPDKVAIPTLRLRLNKQILQLLRGTTIVFDKNIVVDNILVIDYTDMIDTSFQHTLPTESNENDENIHFSTSKASIRETISMEGSVHKIDCQDTRIPRFKMKGKDLAFLDEFNEMTLCIFEDYCVFYAFFDEYTVGVRVCHVS